MVKITKYVIIPAVARISNEPVERMRARMKTIMHIVRTGVRNENAEMEFMNPTKIVRQATDSAIIKC